MPLNDNDNAPVLLMWVIPSRGPHQMVQAANLTWKATRKRIRGRREKVADFGLPESSVHGKRFVQTSDHSLRCTYPVIADTSIGFCRYASTDLPSNFFFLSFLMVIFKLCRLALFYLQIVKKLCVI